MDALERIKRIVAEGKRYRLNKTLVSLQTLIDLLKQFDHRVSELLARNTELVEENRLLKSKIHR